MVGPDSTSEHPYPAACVDDDGQDYLHDAAAAHALMRAIASHCGHNTDWLVLERADHLMRQWGFTDD